MIEATMVEAIRSAITEEMDRDPQVVLLGLDIGLKGGVFRTTEGLLDRFGPERVMDTPLSTAAITGVSIGMALSGLKPVCEIQFADFIFPAVNQIINEAARLHYRSKGDWSVPLVIRTPYGGGIGGGMYHSQSVEAFFTHIPGLKVIIPSNAYDAKGLLKSAVRDPNPVIFLEPKKGYRLFKSDIPEEEILIPIGPAEVTREGEDVSVFCYGMMHHLVLQAANTLAEEGISVEVVDLRTLLPVDEKTILQSVEKTGKALIVHEDNLTGGYGAEIAARIADLGFTSLDAPVKRLAGPDVPGVPFSLPMQDWYMLDKDKISRAIRSLARF